jgi:formylglycine-generating enzyme required for sulfatase activity
VAQQEEVDELRLRIDSVRLYGGYFPGQIVRDPLTRGGSGPEMVVLPVGSFRMGAGNDDSARRPTESPVRSVQFTRGFLLARTEVSVGQFRLFVSASGHRPTSSSRRRSTVYDEKSGGMVERRGVTWEDDFAGHRADDALPVVHVSWEDARAYAAWLAAETGLAYRLPSEAEFEYALRAGSTSAFPWGDGVPPRPIANLTGENDRSSLRRQWANSFRGYGDGFWGPAPVATFEANAFGIHDISGNVSEWVEDCWHDSFNRAPRDGSAWVNPGCGRKVYRGSSWASAPEHSRSAFRSDAAPETTHGRLGFRVARPVDDVGARAAARE